MSGGLNLLQLLRRQCRIDVGDRLGGQFRVRVGNDQAAGIDQEGIARRRRLHFGHALDDGIDVDVAAGNGLDRPLFPDRIGKGDDQLTRSGRSIRLGQDRSARRRSLDVPGSGGRVIVAGELVGRDHPLVGIADEARVELAGGNCHLDVG